MSQGHNAIAGTEASESIFPVEIGEEGDSKLKMLVNIVKRGIALILEGENRFTEEQKNIIAARREELQHICITKLAALFVKELSIRPIEDIERSIHDCMKETLLVMVRKLQTRRRKPK